MVRCIQASPSFIVQSFPCGRLLVYIRITAKISYTVKLYGNVFTIDLVDYDAQFDEIFNSAIVSLDTITDNQLSLCVIPEAF